MKNLVWVAAVLLGLSIVFPNGVPVPGLPSPAPIEPVTPVVQKDKAVVAILSAATAEDRARIVSIYEGMKAVLLRDNGKRINNTDKFAEWQANVLQLAVNHKPGTYPKLDVAIEGVFRQSLGTLDVLPMTEENVKKIVNACDVIIASAK